VTAGLQELRQLNIFLLSSMDSSGTPPATSPPSSPELLPQKKGKTDRHAKGSKLSLTAAVTDRFHAAKTKVEASMAPLF
jgi:hypothetical protein